MVIETQAIHPVTQKMLQLIEILQQKSLIKYRQDFLDVIDMRKQNFAQIKNGQQSFTLTQIQLACKTYKINANWLFGTERAIFRK